MGVEDLAARVAVLEEGTKYRDREVRDLKLRVEAANTKLDQALILLAAVGDLPDAVKALTSYRDEQKGAVGLGKWIVGSGFIGLIGSAGYGIWHFFARAV